VVQRGLGDVIASITPWGRRRYEFKNFLICPNVLAARHAVALDEKRAAFPPTLWEGIENSNATARTRANQASRTFYYQRWFVGAHGDIGGGEKSKLSALTLKWMAEGAAEMGLRFYGTYGADRSPMAEWLENAELAFDQPISYPAWWKTILLPIHYSIRARRVWRAKQPPDERDVETYLDGSVLERVKADHVRPRYNPASLRPFRKLLKTLRQHMRG
jgi:hypothetical protein